jgi:hypothetical protein
MHGTSLFCCNPAGRCGEASERNINFALAAAGARSHGQNFALNFQTTIRTESKTKRSKKHMVYSEKRVLLLIKSLQKVVHAPRLFL